MPKRTLTCAVNGEQQELLVDARATLLEVLRDQLRLTGAKEGCGDGNCGACSVLLEGEVVCSCLVFALEVDGQHVTTVEGIAPSGDLDAVQEAFVEEGGLQCGICTPGFIVATKALLARIPNPTEQEIRLALAGNLCRCTGYDKIVRSVQAAAKGGRA
ncbi:MAG: (2Fe-2S)-binding protein [Chloroflexi bacterium]|nr:(2Fe-2S)-binding protein [Chloroflexota bacterium]